jgi:hypothetical protein
LAENPQARSQLRELLHQCFDTMETYGKEPEQLANAAKLFEMVLAPYPLDKIQAAFVQHLTRSPKMPTPHDIVSLIKRDGKPPLNQATYIALSQKKERTTFREAGVTANCLTIAEEQYMADYEAEMMGVTPTPAREEK